MKHVTYVSVWDGVEVLTTALYNPSTGVVSDISAVDICDSYNACEKEFIRFEDGTEVAVIEKDGQYITAE